MLALTLAGCANDSAPDGMAPLSRLGAPPPADEAEAAPQPLEWNERQFGNPLSTRVLSAIAFEHSTGLPAHPSRIVPNY